MHKFMVDEWNSRVNKEDTLVHTGDVGFGSGCTDDALESLLNSLNGNKILISGNHDFVRSGRKIRKALEKCFSGIYDQRMFKVRDDDAPGGVQRIFCNHYPMLSWPGKPKGVWHLFSHSHGTATDNPPMSLDISADETGFVPVNIEHIKNMMWKKWAWNRKSYK
jgi:calcineurin-like phosphoesterase family protein